jgi:hypothetical protein
VQHRDGLLQRKIRFGHFVPRNCSTRGIAKNVSLAEDEFFEDSVGDRRAGGCAARREKAIFESEVIGIRDHPGDWISDLICGTVRRCRDLRAAEAPLEIFVS